MHTNSDSTRSGISLFRIAVALLLTTTALSMALFSFAAATPSAPPTFGNPVISGIGGVGFEQNLRLDPSNANRLYTSAPGTLSADTSWIWRSLDAGRTFKWVPDAKPFEGKVTTCGGGGDTELGVDTSGHLYFADLTLANFSTARSDDQGATFLCSNSGVLDAVVDRQWYAIDGDPTNGGSIYLANDEVAQAPASCGSPTNLGQNILVMYRSPVAGLSATAGIQFAPANKVSNPLGCDEAIMGNNEISPVATTLGQPNGSGGFAALPEPVKHIFVIHDDALLHKIMIGRCFPVGFGAPVPNVSDPSGLNCTDILVADLGSTQKTGGSFPTMAIDKAGNLYAVWEQAPIDSNGDINGDTLLKYSFSTDQGNTWSAPVTIDTSGSPVGTLRNNVFAWIAAGSDGRVGIAWYGTPGAPTYPSNGPDSCPVSCDWSLWYTQSLNAHSATPTFSAPVQASDHFIHRGSIQTVMGGQNGDRTLGDFLQLRIGAQGEAQISYADSNNIDEVFAPHGIYVRQNGGDGLLANRSPVQITGTKPFNTVSDPAGDGRYEAAGVISSNMPQLDIVGSSVRVVTSAPCSSSAPCYQVVMQMNNLSLAPTTDQDPDTDLVWLTQWLVPSTSDPNGGKNFFAYAESNNGADLQCFVGENAVEVVGGGVALTYPGSTALPAANCQSSLGPNGTITIYVPVSAVDEEHPIDAKLHEVTASTMTLSQPANTTPSFAGIGGSLFNLIDVAQTYVFDPSLATVPPPAQLANISGRVFVQSGDKIGDAGFIIKGSGTKRVLLRGLGPSLPVSDPLKNPVLELFDSAGKRIAFNGNWRATQEKEIQQTGLAPSDNREAAILATLPAGHYTAIIHGAHEGTGVALLEAFDLDLESGSEFVNLSMRADVETDDNVLIDGVIIRGVTPNKILFRALGPSLKAGGKRVPGRLKDPVMELHDANGVLLEKNNDWKDAPNAKEIGSTLPPPNERESAILKTLGPGNYTTIVRGVDRSTGIALNEVFKLQP